MYVPRFNAMADAQAHDLVAAVGAADLITVGADGFPLATRMPVIWDGDRLVFHMAFANPHWRSLVEESPALAIVNGTDAYVTPSWYVAKAEHGRVVPTWNYSAVHFTGRVRVHRDQEWLRAAVSDLTDLHELGRPEPWGVSDAPASFVDQQLKGIVGVEFTIESVAAKAKRSQNRSDADRRAVIEGLEAEGDPRQRSMAAQMRLDLDSL